MRMFFILKVVSIVFLVCFTSGCGSIYIGGTTHTHFYGNEQIDSDEKDIDEIAGFIKYLRQRMNQEAEPMKDFKWTDRTSRKEDTEF